MKCLAFFLLAMSLSGCGLLEIVKKFPVIEAQVPAWQDSTAIRPLTAIIKKEGAAINPELRVRCEVFVESRPAQLPAMLDIVAVRSTNNPQIYSCTLPAATINSLKVNQVVVFRWVVESRDSQGQPLLVADSGSKQVQLGCSDPVALLTNEQRRVLTRFGALTTVGAIGLAGFVPSHGFLSFRGMGVAFVSTSTVIGISDPNNIWPNVLFFLPASGSNAADAFPDEPYRLVGWAYGIDLTVEPAPTSTRFDQPSSFTINRRPALTCFPYHEWFVHEAGVHTLDGGFAPLPVPIGTIGATHGRLWDIHFWADRITGVPKISLLNTSGPGGAQVPSSGYVAPAGSFFYQPF